MVRFIWLLYTHHQLFNLLIPAFHDLLPELDQIGSLSLLDGVPVGQLPDTLSQHLDGVRVLLISRIAESRLDVPGRARSQVLT